MGSAKSCSALGFSVFLLMVANVVFSYFSIWGRWIRIEKGNNVLEGKLSTSQIEIDLWKITTKSTVLGVAQPREELSFDDPHVCGEATVIHLPEEDCRKFHAARITLIVGLILLSLGIISSTPINFSPSGLNRVSTYLSHKGNLPRAILLQKVFAFLTASLALAAVTCHVLIVVGATKQALKYLEKPWVQQLIKIDKSIPVPVHKTVQEGLICTALQLLCSILAMVLALKYWCRLQALPTEYSEIEKKPEDEVGLELASDPETSAAPDGQAPLLPPSDVFPKRKADT